MRLLDRLHARRLDRAKLRVADLEYSMNGIRYWPSEQRRRERDLARARERVARLVGGGDA